MEVDHVHFRRQLLSILKHIANATFVTFDLEMSGISTRRKHGTGDRSQNVGKPTLQETYEEMKDAASTYQVVQLGITCVEEDREKGSWHPSHLLENAANTAPGRVLSSSTLQFLPQSIASFWSRYSTRARFLFLQQCLRLFVEEQL
jgi:hypothetical protein